MTSRKLSKYILLLLMVVSAFSASAAISVQAKLDSAYIVMGRSSTLHLTVTQPKGVKGVFPLLQQVRETGVIPVCGDSVEFRSPVKIDTVESGNSLQISYDVPVQSFDSGFYHLPEFVFVAGNDSARSKALNLKVIPVNAKADDPIHDYASVSEPDGKSIFDWLPDWIVDFWWVFLILLLAIAAFIYALRRYRKEGSLLPKKPEPTPYEAAVKSLRELKAQGLWEKGMEKEYYTELTEILRKYLDGRFGINAMEMTSREILQALSKNKEISEHRVSMRQILDMADFVKFAKVRPLPEDNVKSFDNAVNFVEKTKPVPVAEGEKNPEAKGKSVEPGKKGGVKSARKGGAK